MNLNFWTAFVNILAIVAIIGVAAFILIFVGDLLLNILSKRNSVIHTPKQDSQEQNSVDSVVSNTTTVESVKKDNSIDSVYGNQEKINQAISDLENDTYSTKNKSDVSEDKDFLDVLGGNLKDIDDNLADDEESGLNKSEKINKSNDANEDTDDILKMVDELADDITKEDEVVEDKAETSELDKYSIDDYKFDDDDDDDDSKTVKVVEEKPKLSKAERIRQKTIEKEEIMAAKAERQALEDTRRKAEAQARLDRLQIKNAEDRALRAARLEKLAMDEEERKLRAQARINKLIDDNSEQAEMAKLELQNAEAQERKDFEENQIKIEELISENEKQNELDKQRLEQMSQQVQELSESKNSEIIEQRKLDEADGITIYGLTIDELIKQIKEDIDKISADSEINIASKFEVLAKKEEERHQKEADKIEDMRAKFQAQIDESAKKIADLENKLTNKAESKMELIPVNLSVSQIEQEVDKVILSKEADLAKIEELKKKQEENEQENQEKLKKLEEKEDLKREIASLKIAKEALKEKLNSLENPSKSDLMVIDAVENILEEQNKVDIAALEIEQAQRQRELNLQKQIKEIEQRQDEAEEKLAQLAEANNQAMQDAKKQVEVAIAEEQENIKREANKIELYELEDELRIQQKENDLIKIASGLDSDDDSNDDDGLQLIVADRDKEIEKLKARIAELNDELANKSEPTTQIIVQQDSTKEAVLERIEVLEERLKQAKKEFKINAKEYKPLMKVKKNLEKNKVKLRRKEAIVARKRVALYGVNNIVEIDPEKAEKLANDVELLKGLRNSVQECEQVMLENKDRYPILEQTYNILTKQIADLEHDIEVAKETLKVLEEKDSNDSSQAE